ncbi:FAD-dependent monooxygenase [Nonomuraea sp. NPDC049421]|uniref:FAD-dependent monooxygenase n=1 Tax=Nonomuraea sp. NPDC049421 TaxID=3155275 RepID=UPI0034381E02
MSVRTPRVAVLGAGIGGLTAAATLLRQGFDVDVYEQAITLREAGVGLHLGSNGSRILHRLGLAAGLDAVAVRPAALEVRGFDDGRVFARQPMGAAWADEHGAPYYTVQRSDLLGLLAGLVPERHLHLGRRCTGFTEDADGVRLSFERGPAAEADVLIGADGVHSVVRRAVAGRETPVSSGSVAYRGVVPFDALPGLARDTMFVWLGPSSRLLGYPVAGGRLLTFVSIVPEEGDGEAESWSAYGDARAVARALTGWEPDVRRIVSAIDAVGRWVLRDRAPLERWSTARTTLLGDAAHPMLPHHGQGANQAIEDAAALALCLGQAPRGPGWPETALRRYEQVRRPHTTRVQLGSRGGGSLRLHAPEPARVPCSTPLPRPAAPRGDGLGSMVEDVGWIQSYDVEAALTGS